MNRDNLRNVAIIAHVDHGKTTLVDAMLKQTQTVKDNAETKDLIMDSMDLERERGITIRAKNASLVYNGTKINIVDTPGHADFGGEVERTLRMADGVLLLVDAKEGPMPQTKFVLKKALELGLKAIVVINKVDKDGADPEHAINKTFDLFVKLNATDEQLDFPIIYASGVKGIADTSLENCKSKIASSAAPDVSPLFDAIIKYIPAPEIGSSGSLPRSESGTDSATGVKPEDPFAMLVLALVYDNYKGKLGIGKIVSGAVKKAQNIARIKPDGQKTVGKATSLQMYEGLKPADVEYAEAGDIVAIGGFDDISIGETITDPVNPVHLEPVEIEPPTIKMTFGVNTSPFAGKEGKFVTSRNLRDRLYKELEVNVALKVEPSEEGAESFLVSGRGELHLGVLIETMRREGFELQVSQPQVIFHYATADEVANDNKYEHHQVLTSQPNDGKEYIKLEPYEVVTVSVPSEYQGVIIEEMGRRGGELQHMDSSANSELHAEYIIPTRGLIGLKNLLLTRTRGTVIMNNLFDSYRPVHEIDAHANDHGSLIASETGVSNAYGLNNAQERGILFIGPAVEVYEGMVVGKNALDQDLELNVCKTKKLTNIRSSGTDEAIILTPPRPVELDFALEYIGPDELVEVTPLSIRIRKKILSAVERKRANR